MAKFSRQYVTVSGRRLQAFSMAAVTSAMGGGGKSKCSSSSSCPGQSEPASDHSQAVVRKARDRKL